MSHVLAFALLATLSGAPPEPVQVEEETLVFDGDSRRVIRFTQGKYGRPIEEESFYRLVGRPDLAEEYTRRQSKRRTLGIVGVGLAAGGVVVAGAMGISSCSSSNPRFATECKPGRPMLVAGISALAGMGLFLGGVFIDPHPVAVHEMREMADKHNRTLNLRAGAFVAPGGGGLVFSGRL